MYSDKVMEHFRNPRNMGEFRNPDGVGTVGNPVCGDLMYIYIKVKKQDGKEIIEDISFQTFGCGAAIATSSCLSSGSFVVIRCNRIPGAINTLMRRLLRNLSDNFNSS